MEISSLFANLQAIFWVVFFLVASIFIHELGHFLAARKRGLVVERFSIGFGPKIFSWKRDGVEYRVSWIPLGGYVALPQLADMQGVEGQNQSDVSKLPPISYTSKVIVSAMGAIFNVIFALVLACLLWFLGRPVPAQQLSTTIGYVPQTVFQSDGQEVPAPGFSAGLREGDIILSIDGMRVQDWMDVFQNVATGVGRSESGQPQAVFEIDRNGEVEEVLVNPILATAEALRMVGMAPAHETRVGAVMPNSPAERAGLQAGDAIVGANGMRLWSFRQLQEVIRQSPGENLVLDIQRGEEKLSLEVVPEYITTRTDGAQVPMIGFELDPEMVMVHDNPLEQVSRVVHLTLNTLGSLINPASDIGVRHLSGPVGMARNLHLTALLDFRLVLWMVILININLAILNLLPIPVLDGGHIVFATIQKILGRPLPERLIVGLQGSFMLMLLGMMIYVTVFDSKRWVRESAAEREAEETFVAPEFSSPSEEAAPPGN